MTREGDSSNPLHWDIRVLSSKYKLHRDEGNGQQARQRTLAQNLEWMLLTLDGESFYECLSAGMRNYMAHSIKSKGWTPCYYCPADGKVIIADDVACFFGCQITRSLRGNPSIDCTWSTREPLEAIGTCMESMPKMAFQDLFHCLHFDKDWDKDDKWDKVYVDKK
jgi:hypothetical protein